ncbi:MAG: Ku protein [Chloroflexi bacterium]|nr:Ku protein [Chloroflexota bacterium]
MRAMWSGSISFGLVNIPVRLYKATEETGLDFDYLHKEDLARIRYARMCSAEGREVQPQEIVRGYEYEKGEYVVMAEEDFKLAAPAKTRSIEIMHFALENEIDSMYFERAYYLEPDKGASKAYVLLREALKETQKVGIARFVLSNREHLAAVKPRDHVIVLNQLRFHQEIRKGQELKIPEARTERKEIDLAVALIEQLTVPFEPDKHRDTYTDELKRVIDEKIRGITPVGVAREPEPARVKDLMELLKASLDRERQRERAKAS